MNKTIDRKTLVANTNTEFTFDMKAKKILIKNMTEDYVMACLGDYDASRAIKIPSNTGEVLFEYAYNTDGNKTNWYNTCITYNKVTVNSTAGGEVECRCIE